MSNYGAELPSMVEHPQSGTSPLGMKRSAQPLMPAQTAWWQKAKQWEGQQIIQCCDPSKRVEGSTLQDQHAQFHHCTRGPVAQWIRHRPTEPGIAGSSPAGVNHFVISFGSSEKSTQPQICTSISVEFDVNDKIVCRYQQVRHSLAG